MDFPKSLHQKLSERINNGMLRSMGINSSGVDFSSNDYLGFARSKKIFDASHQLLLDSGVFNGATGSRLLSGNFELYNQTEKLISDLHLSESALIFNSGYDANVGFFSCVPQKNDIILFDDLIHASIRDGIRLSNAKSFKFKHNNLVDLESKIKQFKNDETTIYVATESVFSMDGDSPDILSLAALCQKYQVYLVVDEAHAVGVFGENGKGLISSLGIQDKVFASIITFGKALGCHGAAIIGSKLLVEYLINFSRSFIYTTGLSPHSVATIHTVYHQLLKSDFIENQQLLKNNITHFKAEVKRLNIESIFIESNSAIHCCIISGNDRVKCIAKSLQNNGYDIKPIMSPTVALGKERLRFCLHSYNSLQQITMALETLVTLLKE